MSRLVPYHETQGMADALLEADGLGRQFAHRRAASELAKVAGSLLAHREEELYELEKIARSMVATGLISEEDFEMEKAAAWSGLKGLFSKLKPAVSGARSKMGNLFNRVKSGWSGAKPAATAAAGAVKKAPAKGFGWGAALPWMAAGGLAYGAYKGVPWMARQLEQTSTTPMAHGLGWSPVAYGYGHNPYGAGMPNMGYGA